jgi:hypothetical protein
MKSRAIAIGAAMLVVAAGAALAGEGQPSEKKAGPPAMTPEQQHQMEAPPDVSTGTTEGMMLMGGRYVHMIHHGTMMGQPFEGMMLLGYDNLRKKYTAVWVDSMSTQIGRYEGTYDAATKSITMTGEFLDPSTGKVSHTRGVTAFPDASTMTYDEYMQGPDGKEMHGLHIDYTRS